MSAKFSKFLTAFAASAMAASVASAQAINYTTSGTFSSAFATCNGTATCTGGGFTLNFIPTTGTNIGAPSTVSLGSFSLTGTGDVTVAPGVVTFTLMINQLTPTGGTGSFVGSISGNVSTDPVSGDISNLIWTPNQNVTIDPVLYTLIFDTTGPAAGIGLNIPINNIRGINARVVSTIPEPSTYALMGTGLRGLLGVARRKKNS